MIMLMLIVGLGINFYLLVNSCQIKLDQLKVLNAINLVGLACYILLSPC
jgi:predicted exporter